MEIARGCMFMPDHSSARRHNATVERLHPAAWELALTIRFVLGSAPCDSQLVGMAH
jgi:hypothetical protein